jgi:SPP1 family phage portal protein
MVIRDYKLNGDDVVEIYTAEGITTFRGDSVEEKGHYSFVSSTATRNVERMASWGRVPLIPLNFNETCKNQAVSIRNWVDIYDITMSDFANNIDDFQDVYWILKNYNGQDLDEFMDDLKVNRAMKVGDGGDAKAETIQIPTEARTKFLEIVNSNIFKFGMGVDMEQIGDGNITNVVILSRYAQLDLKANGFQAQLESFLDELMYFVNEYHKITNKTIYEDVTPVFDRSLIINEQEKLETLSKIGLRTSQTTLIENNPLVSNVDEEIERLSQEDNDNPMRL